MSKHRLGTEPVDDLFLAYPPADAPPEPRRPKHRKSGGDPCTCTCPHLTHRDCPIHGEPEERRRRAADDSTPTRWKW